MRMNVGRTRIASVASPVRPRSAAPRPRALFVGGARYDLPLSPGLARKWNAVGKLLEFRVIGRGGEIEVSDSRFRLTRGSRHGFLDVISHAELARVVASEIGRFRPDVVITQSPFEALAVIFATARLTSTHRPKLVVELHGDWRTAARLYGGRWRRPFAKLADRGALLALRRADGIRAVSPRTADLAERTTGRRPLASFPAFVDLEAFSDPLTRLPKQPSVAWIGVLEEPKDPLLLAAAWRAVAREVPDAELVVVGQGSMRPVIEDLVRELPDRVRAIPRLEPPEIARLLDASTLLAVSSRSEGLPRVVLEAFLRGRPVVSRAVGGIRDLVQPERNGLLIEARDPGEFADAIIRVLTDRELAERLAHGAGEAARRSEWSPAGYADAVRAMVDRALSAR